jgi:hypothetical protein
LGPVLMTSVGIKVVFTDLGQCFPALLGQQVRERNLCSKGELSCSFRQRVMPSRRLAGMIR